MIPRFKPSLDISEIKALFRRNQGAVPQFEKEFARKFSAAEAVAFPYGRSALWAFFKANEIHNQEVILPAYTCSVVAHAVSLSGNRPVFVDINLDDYNMNLELLALAINPKTCAIIATHLFGYPMDIGRLEAIVADAEKRYGRKIWLIQDCAHSFAAQWQGRPVGTSGDTALYALNISKMITSIFGGMLTFNDPELAAKVRHWRDLFFQKASGNKAWLRRCYLLAVYSSFSEQFYGLTWWLQNRTSWLDRLTRAYHLDHQIHFPPDYRERMLNVEAAVGLVQLEKYDSIIAGRVAMAQWYDENLPGGENWVKPPIVAGATYSHYVVRVPDRVKVIAAYAARGIELGELIQYSLPELPEYTDISSNCPNAGIASRTTVNFPLYSINEAFKSALGSEP